MKTAVKHCVSSAYQIGTGGGVEGRRGLAPPPIRLLEVGGLFVAVFFNGNRGQGRCADSFLFCAFRRVVAALAVVVSDPRQQLRRGRRPPRPMAARRVVLDVGETDGVVVPQHGVWIPH